MADEIIARLKLGEITGPRDQGADSSPGRAYLPSRNDTIELLRVVAACGVIWFHAETTPFNQIGFSGLVFFLIVSVVFQINAAECGSALDYFTKRGSRLLIPWAAWFLIYGLLNVIRGRHFFPYQHSLLPNILAGPWIGLWYLPFAFVSACLVYSFVYIVRPFGTTVKSIIFVFVGVGALYSVATIRSNGALNAPWAQWLQAAPSVPIGLAMGFIAQNRVRRIPIFFIFNVGLLVVCALLYRIDRGIALSYALGATLVTLGLALERRLNRRVTMISALCLGVYLVHGAVMSGLKLLPFVTDHYLPWFLATVLISFGCVALMRRVPLLSKIV